VIVVALVVIFVVPSPTVAGTTAAGNRAVSKLDAGIIEDKALAEQTREQIMPRVWRQGPDVVSASILSQLTKTALGDTVVIGAFRPQHTTDIGGVTELPFTVQVAGAYPGIHALMSSLDTANTKIVLKSAQIAASQASSNGISATLSISAYIVTDSTILPTPTKVAKHVKD
jgi:Tfp pilus assembly protein PilO